jgi:ABC-type Mn2+/Zn2+ transport system permease subunit
MGWDPSLTAVAITLISTLVIAYSNRVGSRFPPEGMIAIFYMLASSAAILLIAKNPQGETDLMNVLFGNILTVNRRQLIETFAVALPCVLVTAVFFRMFMFTAFDREMASACGIKSDLWQAVYFLMLGTVIVVGIRMSGALLTFAYLVIPAYVGLRLSRSLKGVVAWGLLLGPVSTFLGLWLSFAKDLPTGPSVTIILVGFGLLSFVTSSLF